MRGGDSNLKQAALRLARWAGKPYGAYADVPVKFDAEGSSFKNWLKDVGFAAGDWSEDEIQQFLNFLMKNNVSFDDEVVRNAASLKLFTLPLI